MSRRGILLAALVVPMLALAGDAAAQVLAPQYPGGYRPEFDADKPSEQQEKWSLPPYPADENLLPFRVDAPSPFQFFVDSKSISVDKDGVVRYTLVARSASGALNVSYEGIRCGPLERKLYAFGRSDKTWAPARRAEWAPIPPRRNYAGNQQATLADDFFCRAQGRVHSAEEAVAALKQHRPGR